MPVFKDYSIGRARVRASVTKPREELSSLLPTRMMVHIPQQYRVTPGSILCERRRPYLLLAKHHQYTGITVFSGLLLNAKVMWAAVTTSKHPITNMDGYSVAAEPVELHVVKELMSAGVDKQMDVTRQVLYLGTRVKAGDRIDGNLVRRVDNLSGVYRAEVY